MARRNKFFKHSFISLIIQDMHIKGKYPQFLSSLGRKEYVWTGYLQPTELSIQYETMIKYDVITRVPKTYIIKPFLKCREDKKRIPHTYSENRPCLYLPGTGEWTDQKLIADTIIPWLSLWLFYYEVWFLTGKWLGGGHELSINESKKDK